MMRYALLLEYEGTHYAGWQRQPFLSRTVQGHLEEALSKIADAPIEVTCAGRTDAGVHALGQVVHFDSPVMRRESAWVMGANTHLPPDIRVQQVLPVREDFHARYHAIKRHYRYLLLHHRQPSALWHQFFSWHPRKLEAQKMHQAAQYLCGEHDFSAFRAAECQAKTPYRFIESIMVREHGNWLTVDVLGNAFLHHMVRNIVGSLLLVGDGRRDPSWIKSVLEGRDRRQAGATAPASGLYFYQVFYDEKDHIPRPRMGALPIGVFDESND